MPTEFLQFISGTFSRRFFLNALLPTFVFTTILTLVIVTYTWSLGSAIAWWGRFNLISQVLIVIIYAAAVDFLSAAIASQWRGIVRLFEGYPVSVVAGRMGVAPVGKRWHQMRLDSLRSLDPSDSPDPVTAYYRYPLTGDRDDLLPTRLGNILLAGERYPLDRYGIDAIFFWPRLFPLLPESFQKEYDEFIINHQFPLVVAFESLITATISAATVLVSHGSPFSFVAILIGGAVLAYGGYVLSLSSAEELAEQQRAAFDLYRDRLLTAWPAVRDVKDERAAFEQITDFVVVANINLGWDTARDAYMQRRQPAQEPT